MTASTPENAGASHEAPPFALTETGARGLRVAAADEAAQAIGIDPDMGFTDARAICPHLVGEPIDRAADRGALARLVGWHRRYSPCVSLDRFADPSDAVLLDVSGCAHLFGGEAAMAADMQERLGAAGLQARIALADTSAAAGALARFSDACITIARVGETLEALAHLPVAALRLTADTAQLLRRFGLSTIAQLIDIDRGALKRRFPSKVAAEAVLLRLDQALGARDEPFTPDLPQPAHRVRLSAPEPILHPEGVQAALSHVLEQLQGLLERRDCGGRMFLFTAFRVDGSSYVLRVATARPTRDPAHLQRLFAHHLERIDPGFGIDLFTLEARRTGPLNLTTPALDSDWITMGGDESALCALADRLSARLGDHAVRRLHPVDSHIPERAEQAAPLNALACDGGKAWGATPQRGPRPLRVFEAPEPITVMAEIPDGPPMCFTWRRVARRVVRASGPERIAGEWWRAPDGAEPPTRDYYVVEDEAGRRYWLRRDGFYGHDSPPRWLIQGLFP